MKAKLETKELENRGIEVESENDEEKEILTNIWFKKGRPVAFGHKQDGGVMLTIAPSAEEG